MARAFTPSRSMVFGSPVRDAWQGIANDLMGRLEQWSDDEIHAEYRRQTSNAALAMESSRQELARMMRENQNDPGSWRKTLQKDREKIYKNIMDPITQPDAKRDVDLELKESFQKWDAWLEENEFRQTAFNTNANWKTGRQKFNEPHQYVDETDLRERITAGWTHIMAGFNGGKFPVDDLPTEAIVEDDKRRMAQGMIGDYLTQQTLATGRDDIVVRANEFAERILGEEGKDLFGPEELSKMQKTVKQSIETAKAEAGQARRDQAAIDNRAIRDRAIAGQFTRKDEKGNDVSLLSEVENNQNFTGPEMSEVRSFVKSMIHEYAAGKEYTDIQKIEAYNELSRALATDPQEFDALARKHAAGMGYAAMKPFLDERNKPQSGNSKHVMSALEATVSAIRTMRTNTIKEEGTDDENAAAIAKMNANLARQENQLHVYIKEHPEATPDQVTKQMEAIFAPAKEEAAVELLENIKQTRRSWWKDLVREGPAAVGARAVMGDYEKMPAGLEKYWPKLSDDRRQKVIKLLNQGKSIDRIAKALEK